MLADSIEIPRMIAVRATLCGECCSESSFSCFHIRSKLILPMRSSL